MCGVINCDASLSCAENDAFESTEGPADATKETDLALLHQDANRFDIQWKSSASKGTHRYLAWQ